MKIKCDHCGGLVDVRYENKCNNCGAPYTNNKEYKEYLRKELERKNRLEEVSDKVIDNAVKSFAIGRFISVLVFIIFAVIFVATFMFIINTSSNMDDVFDNETTTNESEVSYNENDIEEKYEIKCDGVIKYSSDKIAFKKKENLDYYGFHIVFNNKTYASLLSEINLTYTDDDGNSDVVASMEMLSSSDEDALDLIATKKGTYKGYVVFGIPSYVKDVKIKYKDTTINIENFKDKME